jgi:hypothetical protein
MTIAHKTLEAIEAAMYADQGAGYRGLLKKWMPRAGDAYSEDQTPFRNHLGASLIGRECPRELWYSFHWSKLVKFDGRMLRLFNTGHLLEPKLCALLEMIGCEIWQSDVNGKQFRISGHRGHFGGSMDGVLKGCPDLPDVPMIVEFKSHGEKSFIKLVAEGVLEAKWEHFIQMQIYMGKNNLTHALYCAVNKNTDELHMEIVQFDPVQYQRYIDRSVMIIDVVEPPPKIATTPGFFKCKFCDYINICHLKELPAKNCRTCVHSSVEDEGEWSCKNWEIICEAEAQGWEDPIILTPELQRAGCERYEMNPAIKS